MRLTTRPIITGSVSTHELSAFEARDRQQIFDDAIEPRSLVLHIIQ
jgi:hypothetical protein